MRDAETIRTAMTAAETGHLVIATLHTKGAVNTIDRIVDSFPADQQDQIKIQLSLVLDCIVSQQLLQREGGGMIPAVEIMKIVPAIQNMIRDSKNYQIDNCLLYTSVKVGGFASPDVDDEVNTLHLLETIDGIRYDLKIYYYQGKVYELFAAEESEMKPEDGVAIMDAKDLHFEKKGSLIRITSKDSEGRENETTVSLRSEESGVALDVYKRQQKAFGCIKRVAGRVD